VILHRQIFVVGRHFSEKKLLDNGQKDKILELFLILIIIKDDF
jgi:hypothetical protein